MSRKTEKWRTPLLCASALMLPIISTSAYVMSLTVAKFALEGFGHAYPIDGGGQLPATDFDGSRDVRR